MTDYTELDAAIVAHIAAGKPYPQDDALLARQAQQLALYPYKAPGWKLIERRMQVLRKAGRIKYDHSAGIGRGQWHVVEPT
jgi:hypothetical protein